tara:strand:+ start:612 stop:812 length:201 start_codon:yes stop_codon:yes gene_type:complete
MGQYGPPTPPHKPPISKQQQKNREQGIRATEAQSAIEYQRRNAERLRKLKYNPDGSLRAVPGANEK